MEVRGELERDVGGRSGIVTGQLDGISIGSHALKEGISRVTDGPSAALSFDL